MDRPPHILNTEAEELDAVDRALAKRDLEDLKRDVRDLTASVDGLVKAWNTATSVVIFVKWLAAAVTAVAAVWLLVKGKFQI